ncbi:MAG: DUF1269 domain-containing protein [Candidatus Eremiobacteraeota bacterium]|nr:DUF1269 domain-containing protein [Candidatus Eremiobacteraeota bacterium]
MSDLIVLAFNDQYKADEVMHALMKMEKEYLVDLDDACIVVRDKKGKVRLKQAFDMTGADAAGGGFWGLLLGLLFLHPLLGFLAGAAAGALSGSVSDYGIDDNFIKQIGKTIEPGTSAIFLLVRKSTPDKVLPELQKFDGKIIRSSLSKEDEAKLQEALKAKPEPAQAPAQA